MCAQCAEHARVRAPVLCCAGCVHKVCVADRGRSPFCVLGALSEVASSSSARRARRPVRYLPTQSELQVVVGEVVDVA